MAAKSLQSQLTQKALLALLAGLTLWMALLMQGSSQVREAAMGTAQTVGLGPLALGHLTKQAVAGGGYSVSLSFESGLLWYFVAWVGLGLVVGYLWHWRQRA